MGAAVIAVQVPGNAAPRPMKMGNMVSLWRYDGTRRTAMDRLMRDEAPV
jgi:hypothetical protein